MIRKHGKTSLNQTHALTPCRIKHPSHAHDRPPPLSTKRETHGHLNSATFTSPPPATKESNALSPTEMTNSRHGTMKARGNASPRQQNNRPRKPKKATPPTQASRVQINPPLHVTHHHNPPESNISGAGSTNKHKYSGSTLTTNSPNHTTLLKKTITSHINRSPIDTTPLTCLVSTHTQRTPQPYHLQPSNGS